MTHVQLAKDRLIACPAQINHSSIREHACPSALRAFMLIKLLRVASLAINNVLSARVPRIRNAVSVLRLTCFCKPPARLGVLMESTSSITRARTVLPLAPNAPRPMSAAHVTSGTSCRPLPAYRHAPTAPGPTKPQESARNVIRLARLVLQEPLKIASLAPLSCFTWIANA